MPAVNAGELRQAIKRVMPLMTAADFCDRNAREIGNQEALIDRRQRLSWSQVKIFSDRLAAGLHRLGLQRNAPILVQLPNQVELFLTRLACEKAGLGLVTAPATFRRAELEPVIRLTQPQAAIIRRRDRGFDYLNLIDEIRGDTLIHRLVVGDDVPAGTISVSELLSEAVRETELQDLEHSRHSILDVCQIATTSGSTGIPKCVEVPLYTRLLTGWIHLRRFGVTATETLAAATPIITGTADALVYNGGCAIGARIILLEHFTAEETCAVLAAENVNVIPLVPTMMVRIMSLADLASYDLNNLRLVINHGAALSPAQGKQFEELLDCRIAQALGSVDCGGISATHWQDREEIRLGTVGKLLEGNKIKIVDGDGKEVTQGETGRLFVRGLHTDARFFKNPALNESSRHDDYFNLQALGRLDGEGNLILIGREQELIIRGGQNIYPADVEAALSQHPAVLEVAVVGIPDEEMGERVWAFVICRRGTFLTLTEMKTFLADKGLAKFKWPEGLQVIEALPKVAAGHKVDRLKLRALVKS